ncbi:MAG TPA: AbrB family transcriptional regulator [Usitatibacter sp.]|nr:AbrB family transcriptional regulator [Usitatibacter sp.]
MNVASWPAPAKWVVLLVLSVGVTSLWSAASLPAALLIGPMIAGIVLGVNGARLDIPRWSYLGAQGVIAAMIAGSMTPATAHTLGHGAVLFVAAAATTLIGATALGWLMSRTGLMPGATAVYGMSPGAASAMVMLSEAHGADKSLVAFMQYTRVLCVAFATTLVAHFWAGGTPHPPGAGWLAPVNVGNLALVLALAFLSQQVARLSRLQGYGLIGPMILMGAIHAMGWIEIDLPRWLLAISYALLGWHIGLGFRRQELIHAGRALPLVLGGARALVAFCGLVSWAVAWFGHVDGLTAYLAMSPGGADVAAIIASSTPSVDLPFVLALQSIRLFATIALAPFIIRLVVRHSPHLRGE